MLKSFFDFCLIINEKKFECNKLYACCVSDLVYRFVQENPRQSSIILSVSPEVCQLLFPVLNLLLGSPLFQSSSILQAFSFLQVSFVEVPNSVSQAFEILAFDKNSSQLAVDFLAQNFSSIEKKDFSRISLEKVCRIFASEALFLPNENFLFEIFFDLFRDDPRSISLIKYIHLYAVDSAILTSFLNTLTSRDLTDDIFDVFKKRSSFPVLISEGFKLPSKRWANQAILAQNHEKKFTIFQNLDDSYDLKKKNLVESQQLKERVEQLEKEKSELISYYENKLEECQKSFNEEKDKYLAEIRSLQKINSELISSHDELTNKIREQNENRAIPTYKSDYDSQDFSDSYSLSIDDQFIYQGGLSINDQFNYQGGSSIDYLASYTEFELPIFSISAQKSEADSRSPIQSSADQLSVVQPLSVVEETQTSTEVILPDSQSQQEFEVDLDSVLTSSQTDAISSHIILDHLEKGKQILHTTNNGSAENHEVAEHFRFAAECGNAEAQVLYGCCLFRGWGVKANYQLAREYFQLAKEQGSVDGFVWYWIMDWENGADFFKEAADKRHPGALFWYGVCIFYGFVSNISQSDALNYFELSFESGDRYWAKQYAALYRLGYFGIVQSEESARHFEEIADSFPMNDTSFFSPGFF